MTDEQKQPEISVRLLLQTQSMSVRDMVCRGQCRHRSPEECSTATHMVFPYRGVYVRHVGHSESVAEANQVVFFNESESYRISHPVGGGDACISVTLGEPLLRELAPKEHLRDGGPAAFAEHRLRIDPGTQAFVAQLRHSLVHGVTGPLETESMTLALVRRALGGRMPSHTRRASLGHQKLVYRAKLMLSTDPARRWAEFVRLLASPRLPSGLRAPAQPRR